MSVPARYTRTQIMLHWAIAALVVFQILFHGGIEELWDARMSGAAPNVPVPTPHTIAGFVILLLMLWRVALRLRHGAPKPPESEHPALRFLAGATHIAFYVLLIGMPISGAVAWFGGFEVPAAAHSLAGKALIALVVLHLAGALAHQFVFRTDVLMRMSLRGKAGA